MFGTMWNDMVYILVWYKLYIAYEFSWYVLYLRWVNGTMLYGRWGARW